MDGQGKKPVYGSGCQLGKFCLGGYGLAVFGNAGRRSSKRRGEWIPARFVFRSLDVRVALSTWQLPAESAHMTKSWEDMTSEEKLEWLQHEDQSTRQVIAGISARLDEVVVSS